jgi:anti-anti-sigma factor
MELEIKNHSDQITHLALRGRLDTAAVGEIELKFTSHTVPTAKPLLLDMSEVIFVSSLGLRMLVTVAKALDHRGVKMVLLNPQPGCARGPQTFGIRSADAHLQRRGDSAGISCGRRKPIRSRGCFSPCFARRLCSDVLPTTSSLSLSTIFPPLKYKSRLHSNQNGISTRKRFLYRWQTRGFM